MELSVTASRSTSRSGSHEDDRVYLEQVAETVADALARSKFTGQLELALTLGSHADRAAGVEPERVMMVEVPVRARELDDAEGEWT
jgi:hypothetical protein